MGMFGSNNKDYITQEQLDEIMTPLLERIDKLETAAQKQAKLMAELEQQLKAGVGTAQKSDDGMDSSALQTVEGVGLTEVPSMDSYGLGATEQSSLNHVSSAESQTFYLPAPTSDGQFLESSGVEQVGKSIYQLRTEDGINGQFIMLSTPDAIATASISISQFVKPVCRIEGNTHQIPRQIETLEEGMAQRDGNVWKVVRKARVSFQ